MTHEELVAEELVKGLLGETYILTEDRIDDLIAKYPEARLSKHLILQWAEEYDPTRNKKYIPWIVKQYATGKLKLPDQGELLRDNLLTFERLITIPAYTGPRDIYQMKTPDDLDKTMQKFGELKSKTQAEREKKLAGQTSLAKVGPYEVIKITEVSTLNHWGWRAYSHPVENPNWAPRKPITPNDMPPNDISDRKWCIRWPTFATTYLSSGPFYLVLKNGGPYVGIVWERGECQDLDNHGIGAAQAEEIYPVLKEANIIPEEKDLDRNCRVFNDLKFLHGDVPDGSEVTGPIDLSKTKLTALPSNLSVKGMLDISQTPIQQLPPGLKVEGVLKIQGTPIKEFPPDLFVQNLEWSEPITYQQVKELFLAIRMPDMKVQYELEKKGMPKRKVEAMWKAMEKGLRAHFMTDPDIDADCQAVFPYRGSKKAQ